MLSKALLWVSQNFFLAFAGCMQVGQRLPLPSMLSLYESCSLTMSCKGPPDEPRPTDIEGA